MNDSLAVKVKRFAHKSPREMLEALGANMGIKHSQKAGSHNWKNVADYIPFAQTVERARAAGLSVGDYIEKAKPGEPTPTQITISRLVELGVFVNPIETLVEIGPGSGRYLEKTLRVCRPSRCEIYETAGEWASFIVREYGAIWQPTDGSRLSATPDAAADLVQAHKVFCTIPFLETVRYWHEMVRITKPGGFVVFDVMSEQCLSVAHLNAWAVSGSSNGSSYPAAFPSVSAVAFFSSNRFDLIGRFCVPLGPGETEVLVFRKKAT